jgi:hypothetical protein
VRRARLILVLAVAALALVGCTPTAPITTPAPADVVGTWHHGSDTVTLDADGTFAIAGMPKGVIEQASIATGAAPTGPDERVAGTWSIGSGGSDVGGAPGVRLVFQSPAKIGYNSGLTLIVADGNPLQLYVTLGRPDSNVRYTFSKK